MAVTVTGTLTQTIDNWFVKTASATMENILAMKQFAIMTPLPKGNGVTTYWNRWTDLGWADKLAEGTAPTAVALSATRVSATVRQRSKVAAVSDLFQEASAINASKGAIERISYTAAKSLDTLMLMTMFQKDVWNTKAGGSSTDTWANPSAFKAVTAANAAGLSCWLSGLSSFNGTRLLSGGDGVDGNAKTTALAQYIVSEMSGTAATIADLSTTVGAMVGGDSGCFPLKGKDVRQAVAKLRSQNIPSFDGMYICIVNAAVEAKLMADSEFQEACKYVNPTRMYQGEIVNLWGARFIRSEQIIAHNISGVGKTAQANFVPIFGKGCYGLTELAGGLRVFRTPPGGQSDPVHQIYKIGVKLSFACCLVNASAGVLVFCTTPRS